MEQPLPTTPKTRVHRYTIMGVGILILGLVGGFGALVYAAVSQPTGTVVVTTYDVSDGSRKKLGGVIVAINSYKYDKECSDSIKSTERDAGDDMGRVRFTGCPIPVVAKNSRKYQKYVVVKVIKPGYQISQKSPFKVGANKAASRGGSFAVKKNTKTFVNLYLEREGWEQITRQPIQPKLPVSNGGGPGAATVTTPNFTPFSCGAVANNHNEQLLATTCNPAIIREKGST